jgi:MFS family permease
VNGSRSLWRHRDFLKLWSGETVSLLGDQFTSLAFPLAAVLILNATSAEMGALTALSTLPFLLFGLIAGVWADRYRRKRMMIISDVARAALLVAVPLAFVAKALTIYLLYSVTFLTGVFTVFFDIAYQSYLPVLVDRDQLVDANGKMEASRAAAQVVGPSLAGGTVQLVSAPFAIFVDAISFVWSAASLSWIRKKEEVRAKDEHGSITRDIKEGLLLVLRDPRLRSISGCTATANFFSSIIFAILVLFAVDVLGMSPFSIGLMFAAGSVGSLLGAFSAGRFTRLIPLGWTIIISSLIGAAGWFLMLFASPPYGSYIVIASLFITSLGAVVYNINQVSYRQALVPIRMQGRLNASIRFIVWGTLPVGAAVGGILGQIFGLRAPLLVGSLGGFIAVLWVLLSPVRRVRSMPEQAEETTGP